MADSSSHYISLTQEQRQEVDLRMKLIFNLCTREDPFRESLMAISQEANSFSVKLKHQRETHE